MEPEGKPPLEKGKKHLGVSKNRGGFTPKLSLFPPSILGVFTLFLETPIYQPSNFRGASKVLVFGGCILILISKLWGIGGIDLRYNSP